MLKNRVKKQIIRDILLEKVSKEIRLDNNFVRDIAQCVNHTYNKYRSSSNNLESNLITKNVEDIGSMFFLSDVYEDFVGKNPKMSIYNSHEIDKNLIFLKKERELSVFENAMAFYYDFKTCVLNCDLIFLNFSYKNFFICGLLFTANFIIMAINILASAVLFMLSGVYFIFFRIYRFLYQKRRFFSKRYFFIVFFTLFYVLSGCLKYILIFTRMSVNTVFNFFHMLNRFLKIAVDEKNLFSFSKKNKKNKVDRKKRSVEHRSLLDFVYKKSKQRTKEMAKHDLRWLSSFKIQEFILGDFNYEALPDGEEKECYKSVEISEKMELLTKILQKAFKIRAIKWRDSLELMDKLNILKAKFRLVNKNLEKELLENKILLDNLNKTADFSAVVSNKDL
ncbi:MAG: hypothetical protein LBG48_04215 [Rickettsiales bacterium]|jgi:hypothetical protein|nr:hypothetical protein [Rickettsiales bacterium]